MSDFNAGKLMKVMVGILALSFGIVMITLTGNEYTERVNKIEIKERYGEHIGITKDISSKNRKRNVKGYFIEEDNELTYIAFTGNRGLFNTNNKIKEVNVESESLLFKRYEASL